MLAASTIIIADTKTWQHSEGAKENASKKGVKLDF